MSMTCAASAATQLQIVRQSICTRLVFIRIRKEIYFIYKWMLKKTIHGLVETFTDNFYLVSLSFLQWSLFDYTFTKAESNAATDAFTDYLMIQISGEQV